MYAHMPRRRVIGTRGPEAPFLFRRKMARVGSEGTPPRFFFAGCLAVLAALCFMAQAAFGAIGQFLQAPPPSTWGQKKPVCPTVEMLQTSVDPWAYDAMLDVDASTGLCTHVGTGRVVCPDPIPGCESQDYP